ncbi:helix-turn-helix domain-containing protein [Duganella dendranthematis]|uniref:Helix-turn-helix domain-containing protein n=1 Tax=Duganella dendranthematis TaxID=2728021 RepID=A0ABX6MCC8_9BURK|nr:helix-turn-helix domain-containing protein [Duganella dendranthematis]
MNIEIRAMSKEDVAEIVGCSVRNIEKMIKSGDIPEPKRLGGLVRWHSQVIYDWLNRVLGGTNGTESVQLAPEMEIEKTKISPTHRKATAQSNRSDAIMRMRAREARNCLPS